MSRATHAIIADLRDHWQQTTWPIFTESADRLEELSAKLTEAIAFWEQHRARVAELEAEMKKPVPQPNSQGMTSWEAGYAARCAELRTILQVSTPERNGR